MIRYSVIIPTYNYARFLNRAINSALAQDCESMEILVVDDGSTDETGEVLKDYDSKVNVIRQENSGVSAARNRGAKDSVGEWLLFLDADDELQPEAIESFDHAIADHPAAKFFIASSISVDENGKQNSPSRPRLSNDRHLNFERFIRRELSIAHGAVLMHRTNFESVQYPVGIKNGEDIVLFSQSLALFDAASVDATTVHRFAHPNRQREKIESIRESELKTVDALFSKDVLPEEYFKYRNAFEARRHLSLGRSFLKSGFIEEARNAYWSAFKIEPRLFFFTKHLIRFLKTYFIKERPK